MLDNQRLMYEPKSMIIIQKKNFHETTHSDLPRDRPGSSEAQTSQRDRQLLGNIMEHKLRAKAPSKIEMEGEAVLDFSNHQPRWHPEETLGSSVQQHRITGSRTQQKGGTRPLFASHCLT